MKKIIAVSFCFISCASYAQLNSENLRGELSTASKYGSKQTGVEGLQSFSSRNVTGSQFYYPNWLAGSLITPTNQTDAADYLFLYDKVRQQLFMKAKNTDEVLEVSKDKIHGFTLTNNGTHNFTVASEYNPANTTDFYEILVRDDAGYTLLKSVKTKFITFDPTDMVKMKSGNTNDEFDDEVTYYVSYKHGAPQSVKIKDGNIKKAMAADKSRVDNYFNDNYAAERNEDFLVGLVRSVNS